MHTDTRLTTPPASPRDALAEIVAGLRSSTWLPWAQVLGLIEEAPGAHHTLATIARCHGRGVIDRQVRPLLAVLADDLGLR